MNRPRHLASMALATLAWLTACQPLTEGNSPQIDTPKAETLLTRQHCGRNQPTPKASWIDNAQQLQATLGQIQRRQLGGQAIDLPSVDFQQELIVLIEMGQKPTLGYGLKLADGQPQISQGRASLTLHWVTPAAGAPVAQTISSPCLLLKLDRGPYTSIRILDRAGDNKAAAHAEIGRD